MPPGSLLTTVGPPSRRAGEGARHLRRPRKEEDQGPAVVSCLLTCPAGSRAASHSAKGISCRKDLAVFDATANERDCARRVKEKSNSEPSHGLQDLDGVSDASRPRHFQPTCRFARARCSPTFVSAIRDGLERVQAQGVPSCGERRRSHPGPVRAPVVVPPAGGRGGTRPEAPLVRLLRHHRACVLPFGGRREPAALEHRHDIRQTAPRRPPQERARLWCRG